MLHNNCTIKANWLRLWSVAHVVKIYTGDDPELVRVHAVQVRNAANGNNVNGNVFCGSLSVEQAQDESCSSYSRRNKAGFITRVVSTPTANESSRAVRECWGCRVCTVVTSFWLGRGKVYEHCNARWQKKTYTVNNGNVTWAVRCFQSNSDIRTEQRYEIKFCVARLGLEYLAKHNDPNYGMTHAAYSLDLSPCDFRSFPEVKRGLRGRKFGTDAVVIQAVTTLLNQIPREKFRKMMLEKWDGFSGNFQVHGKTRLTKKKFQIA